MKCKHKMTELIPTVPSQVMPVQADPTPDSAIYEELSNRRSVYMEVQNEAYKRYQQHSFNLTTKNIDTSLNPEYDIPK